MDSPRDIGRVIRGTWHSYEELKNAVLNHTAFQQELLLGIVLTPIALWIGDDGVQRAMLIGTFLVVLMVELVNSAIETVVDRVSQEHNELSGKAKVPGFSSRYDIASRIISYMGPGYFRIT